MSHLVHHCPFSRACFLATPLGLKTNALHGNFEQILLDISVKLEDDQWLVYVNSVWALWRYMNDRAYSGKQPDLQLFFKYLNLIAKESRTGAASKYCSLTERVPSSVTLAEVSNDYACFSDGSWAEGWCGGIGIVVWFKKELIIYKSKAVRGCCPLQVKALALKESMQIVIGLGIKECSFYSDCLELVRFA